MALGIKTGGRQKGTPNKTTGSARQVLIDFLHQVLPDLPNVYAELDASDKMKVILALSKILIPTPQETNEDGEIQVYTGSQFNINSIEIIHTSKDKKE